jgi:hypothetical protein
MKRLAISLALLALLGCCGRGFAQNGPPPAPVVKPSTLPPVVMPSTPPPVPVVKPPSPPPVPAPKPAASGEVWGALIYATNGRPAMMPDSVPADLSDLSRRLGKVFPYTRFEILGNSRELFLKLASQGPAPGGGLRLDLQFWHLDKMLVKTDVALRPRSPLFIAGPRWREGRLIFVLQLTEGAHKR